MERRVLVWANNYYGKSLGLDKPVLDLDNPANEKRVLQEYDTLFEKPLAYMLTGTQNLPESRDVLNNALASLAKCKITDWIYTMKYWVDNDFFVYTGDFNKDLENCINKVQSEMGVLFGTASLYGTDICLHTHHGRVIGNIPTKLFIYGKLVRTKFGGTLLIKLVNAKPSKTSSAERELLRIALEKKVITDDLLATESVTVPINTEVEEVCNVNAVSPLLPPSEYLALAEALPTSLLNKGLTQLSIIKDYVKSMKVSEEVMEYINNIPQASKSAAELNDDTVLDYLKNKHGMDVSSIGDLSVRNRVPTLSMTNIDSELLKGSAKDLLEAFKEVDETELSTLDAIITDYCRDNKIDLSCTISQLIDSICYDTHPTVMSAEDIVLQDAKKRNVSMDTTLDEYIKGVTHKDVDDVDVFIKFMDDYKELFPAEVRNPIMEGLLNHEPIKFEVGEIFTPSTADVKTMSDFLSGKEELIEEVVSILDANGIPGVNARNYLKSKTDIDDVVATLCLSEDDKSVFLDKLKNNETYDILEFTSNRYSDVLGSSWLDIVKEATSKNTSVVKLMEDDMLEGLAATLCLDSTELDKLTKSLKEGSTYELAKPARVDDGYAVGELMLRKVREVLKKDASFETRTKYTPILYAFLRMLMADPVKEKESLLSFLDTKINEANGDAKSILQQAKALLN